MKSTYMFFLLIWCIAYALLPSASEATDFSAQLRDRIEQYASPEMSNTIYERMRMMQFLNEHLDNSSIEIRPEVSEDTVSSSIRFLTAQSGNRPAVQKSLIILNEIERLKRNAYIYDEEIYCYRLLLKYKTLEEIILLHQKEKTVLENYMQQAEIALKKNQLSEIEWAKANTFLLDINSSISKLLEERIKLKNDLRMRLGADAPLKTWAQAVRINTMIDKQAHLLLETALENRTDYLLLQKRKHLAHLNNEALLNENQFHLQYFQPQIEHDLNDHSMTVSFSASFQLPWSSTQTDSMIINYEIRYYQELIEEMKKRITDEIDIRLLNYHEQCDLNDIYDPHVIDTLEKKWNALAKVKLLRADQLRDTFYLRSHILKYKTTDLERALREQEYYLDLLKTCEITP